MPFFDLARSVPIQQNRQGLFIKHSFFVCLYIKPRKKEECAQMGSSGFGGGFFLKPI